MSQSCWQRGLFYILLFLVIAAAIYLTKEQVAGDRLTAVVDTLLEKLGAESAPMPIEITVKEEDSGRTVSIVVAKTAGQSTVSGTGAVNERDDGGKNDIEGGEVTPEPIPRTVSDCESCQEGVAGGGDGGHGGIAEGVIFSVGHLKDAKDSKAGICLDKYQRAWLSELRQGIRACSEGSTTKLELEVIGYASVAPMTGLRGVADQSDWFNVEVANQRAAVVSRFLELSDGADTSFEACKIGLDGLNPFKGEEKESGNYTVNTRLWEDSDLTPRNSMRDSTPVDNGSYPQERKYLVEVFNRSVHIIFKNDACWRGSGESNTVAGSGVATP